MRKITKILSLVLVFAMLTLALASCSATAEERVMAAMAKMAVAKKTDCTAIMETETTIAGMSYSIPVTMAMKLDASNAESPMAQIETSVVNPLTGQATVTTMFYKDGYLYTNAGDYKTKVKVSFEDMVSSNTGLDMQAIFEEKKDAIDDSFEITENEDGSLTVKMTVTKSEFATDLEDFANEIAGSLGEGQAVEISDTVFEFTIDKGNNITELKTAITVSILAGGQVISSNTTKFTNKYNAIGADFGITFPTDLDTYKLIG